MKLPDAFILPHAVVHFGHRPANTKRTEHSQPPKALLNVGRGVCGSEGVGEAGVPGEVDGGQSVHHDDEVIKEGGVLL